MAVTHRIRELLDSLYGDSRAAIVQTRLDQILHNRGRNRKVPTVRTISNADCFLIVYGDQLKEEKASPLQTLTSFCRKHLQDIITVVHLLPFFPYTSDDGFSVMDYRKVNPSLGGWKDISNLGSDFKLMFDAVVNHVSSKHEWFQAFLEDNTHYMEYFIVVKGNPDLSMVVRPRALPLLTEFETHSGRKRIWTTFSEDQIDLNFSNPDVLLEIVDTLLFYVSKGASFLRLDAVAFLWKDPGTPCVHLPQTHQIIQLFRAILDEVAPHVFLITETNVPHVDNISYFGDGTNEAQMVYNFALPPLLLHTFHTANSQELSRWASSLKLPSDSTTFFNFLASHDGIGLIPVRGILSEAAIEKIVARCLRHGGLVSYKQNADGTQSFYELNINYFDALSDPAGIESVDLQVDRFIAAHFILLSLVGVPAIYFHSLLGSRSWSAGPNETGRNRSINRQKLSLAEVELELNNPESLRSKVLSRFKKLLKIRGEHSAFDPKGSQRILDFGSPIFALERISPDQSERILCVQNISAENQAVMLGEITSYDDLLEPEKKIRGAALLLSPYQGSWILASVR